MHSEDDTDHSDNGGGSGHARRYKKRVECQVKGCKSAVNSKAYYRRYRICVDHCNMPSLMLDGTEKRWCQQCGRFQDLPEFDGDRKTCRAKLDRHNSRRKNARSRVRAAGKRSYTPVPFPNSPQPTPTVSTPSGAAMPPCNSQADPMSGSASPAGSSAGQQSPPPQAPQQCTRSVRQKGPPEGGLALTKALEAQLQLRSPGSLFDLSPHQQQQSQQQQSQQEQQWHRLAPTGELPQPGPYSAPPPLQQQPFQQQQEPQQEQWRRRALSGGPPQPGPHSAPPGSQKFQEEEAQHQQQQQEQQRQPALSGGPPQPGLYSALPGQQQQQQHRGLAMCGVAPQPGPSSALPIHPLDLAEGAGLAPTLSPPAGAGHPRAGPLRLLPDTRAAAVAGRRATKSVDLRGFMAATTQAYHQSPGLRSHAPANSLHPPSATADPSSPHGLPAVGAGARDLPVGPALTSPSPPASTNLSELLRALSGEAWAPGRRPSWFEPWSVRLDWAADLQQTDALARAMATQPATACAEPGNLPAPALPITAAAPARMGAGPAPTPSLLPHDQEPWLHISPTALQLIPSLPSSPMTTRQELGPLQAAARQAPPGHSPLSVPPLPLGVDAFSSS